MKTKWKTFVFLVLLVLPTFVPGTYAKAANILISSDKALAIHLFKVFELRILCVDVLE